MKDEIDLAPGTVEKEVEDGQTGCRIIAKGKGGRYNDTAVFAMGDRKNMRLAKFLYNRTASSIRMLMLICAIALCGCGPAGGSARSSATTEAAAEEQQAEETTAEEPAVEETAAEEPPLVNGAEEEAKSSSGAETAEEISGTESGESAEPTEDVPQAEMELRLSIGQEEVTVVWEDNEAVDALKALAEAEPLTIDLSMYGGFEQVGPLGTSLPRADEQITTKAGDIVLYAGDQISVFYGENTWDYTMLGHITEPGENALTGLLSNGDTSLTLFTGQKEAGGEKHDWY